MTIGHIPTLTISIKKFVVFLEGVFVVGVVLQPLGEVAFWAVSVVAACALQEFVRFVQKKFVVS